MPICMLMISIYFVSKQLYNEQNKRYREDGNASALPKY